MAAPSEAVKHVSVFKFIDQLDDLYLATQTQFSDLYLFTSPMTPASAMRHSVMVLLIY